MERINDAPVLSTIKVPKQERFVLGKHRGGNDTYGKEKTYSGVSVSAAAAQMAEKKALLSENEARRKQICEEEI